ncbi:MAG: glycosyltransferase family 2 protein [Endomicrobiia bacterium]
MTDYELSVVLPCLNERLSIGICIEKIKKVFEENSIKGEIIVVDNGSTDGSVELVRKEFPFVKLFFEYEKGYGSALRRGIEESQGKYIIMGDADDTYDFLEIPKFLKYLREGYDLVMGSRFKGKILKGAMTWSHRYIGNPILSGMLRLLFGGKVSDAHCGLRGFSKEAYKIMGLHTTGMEFASEMVIHSLKKRLKIVDVPISYYPRKGESKLSSFRDAWRHIRFMLLYSPGYLFLYPGIIIFLISFIVTVKLVFGNIYFLGRGWGIHVMVFSAMFTLFGWQLLNLGLAAKSFAQTILLEEDKLIKKVLKIINLERAMVFGLGLVFVGLVVIGYIFYIWYKNNFGALTQVETALLSLTIIIMGLQTIFTAFLISMFQIKYR